jgi:hypothetical protein
MPEVPWPLSVLVLDRPFFRLLAAPVPLEFAAAQKQTGACCSL